MPGHLLSIQALRALAALGVALLHASILVGIVEGRAQVSGGVPLFTFGNVGVDLFFVISGFVMVHSADRLFGSAAGAGTFLLRRLIRIVPVYWLVTTLTLLLSLLVVDAHLLWPQGTTWGDVFASYVFLSTRLDGEVYRPLLTVGWTLNYEMFFYAVFAGFVLLPRRAAVLSLCAFFVLFSLFGWHLSVPSSFAFLTVDWRAAPMFLEFVFGMALGLACREGLRIPRPVAWVLVLIGSAALLYLWTTYAMPGKQWPRHLVCGLPFAVILIGFVFAVEPSRPGAAWRITAFLGDSSYSLYLVHLPAMVVMLHLMPGASLWMVRVPGLLTLVLVSGSIAVAAIFYVLVERPMTDWLRTRAGGLAATRGRGQPAPA